MEQALPKVLGILGGLGPMATVYFYEMLTRHTQAARDQDHIDVIINSRATTPDRTSYILGQSAENPFDIMAADAARLVTFGADVIAIPCNTATIFTTGSTRPSPSPS
jgi:aspartate racemase